MDTDSFSKRDLIYLKAAGQVSKLSDHRIQVGCVIVNKHRIISSGNNSATKCHPIQKDLDTREFNCECAGKVHAESDAIIYCLKNNIDLKNATIYVYREHRDGSFANARPCSRCMSLIKKYGIRKIKYTTDMGYASEFVMKEF